jgi:ribonucleoside-diphosphate reductase alpha chain
METYKSIYDKLSEERLDQQLKKQLPNWMTTPGYQLLKEKYLFPDETYKQRIDTIAKTAARYMKDEYTWYLKFYELLWHGFLSPSTPILANMGRDKGCPVSCASSYVHDSIKGFYDSLQEAALLTKEGFGTSGYLGDIRPRGSLISGMRGSASGVLPVFQDFVTMSRKVSQGSQRRGAWAGYLPIDHGDFNEVLSFISKEVDDANIGWCISSKFIERLNNNDSEAIDRYQRALKLKMVSGKGYFFFPDKNDNLAPQWFKDNNLKIKGSNLCVAPETLILTDIGYQPISELENEEIKIWNGEEFTKTKVIKTGINQRLIKVVTSSGQEVECTPYHKFHVVKDYYGRVEIVKAIDLKEGDKLIKFDLPTIEGFRTLRNAYHNGFYTGDGYYSKGKQIVYFYHEKRKLKHLFEGLDGNWCTENSQNRERFITTILKDKFFVPTSNYTISSKLEWLAGLADSDGTVAINGSNRSLQIGSINKPFLLAVQLMLQELGITSKVTFAREAGQYLMPDNKGDGELSLYACKESYRLLIGSNMLVKLQSLGFITYRLILGEQSPDRNAEQFIKVMEVIDEGRRDDTYCFTEPSRNMGMFNGLLLGNCIETTPTSDKDNTYTCILSSLNISRYNLWKDSDTIFNSTVFLHCVAMNFIDIASKIPGLEKAVNYTKNYRSLGLGTLGYATYLQEHNLPFESMAAHYFNCALFKEIDYQSSRASSWLVKEFGEAPIASGYNRANALRIAIAPNLSSALIAGGVSQGIEPIYKNAYVQATPAGKVNRINPTLLKVMKRKDVYNDKTVNEIIKNSGSVKNVDWLTDEEKDVFKTAFEINQKSIINNAAIRQRYIDQGQSINLFFSADESEEYISEVHKEAFLNPYIKGLYYIRSETGIPVSDRECVACEG